MACISQLINVFVLLWMWKTLKEFKEIIKPIYGNVIPDIEDTYFWNNYIDNNTGLNNNIIQLPLNTKGLVTLPKIKIRFSKTLFYWGMKCWIFKAKMGIDDDTV